MAVELTLNSDVRTRHYLVSGAEPIEHRARPGVWFVPDEAEVEFDGGRWVWLCISGGSINSDGSLLYRQGYRPDGDSPLPDWASTLTVFETTIHDQERKA